MNCIIKGWIQSLTPESKGRFLANNIFLALCLVKAQNQLCLVKKTLANLPPSMSDNTSFLTYSPIPPQSGRHICINA